MQFAADGKPDVELYENGKERLAVSKAPDNWTVAMRLNEAAIPNARESQEEALAYAREDGDAEGGEEPNE